MKPEQKKVIVGIASVAILASLGMNAYLFTELNTVKENMVDKTNYSIFQDEMIKATSDTSDTTPNSEQLKSFIMANPEVVVKSLAKYRFTQEQLAKKQESQQMQTLTGELYNDKNDPFIGNPNGKNIVVEFIDYNCGYCKRLAPTLERWVAIDPEAKLIIKEYPIFTNQPTSAYSALIATAVFYLDPQKYQIIHNELMASPKITRAGIDTLLANNGVSKEVLQPYLEKAKEQIEKIRSLGAQLDITGTPTVFHNGERSHGGFTPEQLKASFN